MTPEEIKKLASAIKQEEAISFLVDLYIAKTAESAPLTGLDRFKDLVEKTAGIKSWFRLLFPPVGWGRTGLKAVNQARVAQEARAKLLSEAEKILSEKNPSKALVTEFNNKLFEKAFAAPFEPTMIEDALKVWSALTARYGERAVLYEPEFASVRRLIRPYLELAQHMQMKPTEVAGATKSTIRKILPYVGAAAGGLGGGYALGKYIKKKRSQTGLQGFNNPNIGFNQTNFGNASF